MGRRVVLKESYAVGTAKLTNFFAAPTKPGPSEGSSNKPKRGRPSKKKKPRTGETQLALSGDTPATVVAAAVAPLPKPRPKSRATGGERVDWSAVEHLPKLTKAVNDWLNEEGEFKKGESKDDYATRMGIPKATCRRPLPAPNAARCRLR